MTTAMVMREDTAMAMVQTASPLIGILLRFGNVKGIEGTGKLNIGYITGDQAHINGGAQNRRVGDRFHNPGGNIQGQKAAAEHE